MCRTCNTETECRDFCFRPLPVGARNPTRLVKPFTTWRAYKDLDASVILRTFTNHAASVFDGQLRPRRLNKVKRQRVLVCPVALDHVNEDPVFTFHKVNIATMRDGARESPITIMRSAEEIEFRFADPFERFRIRNCLPGKRPERY